MSELLPVDAVLFGFLVFSGIIGNILVIYIVVQSSLNIPTRRLPAADLILVNLSLANLLTSCFRTVPIFVSDLGLAVSLSSGWCRLFMLLWVWWRSVGCWSTLGLSVFHCVTLRRRGFVTGELAQGRGQRRVVGALVLVWGINLACSLPALVYTTYDSSNASVELMVISCTMRPLLGCVWEFPSKAQGTAFATSSLVLNELLPLLLMVGANCATLAALHRHIHSVTGARVEGGGEAQVMAERRAARVIMVVVFLFVVCWVLQVTAVTYYNYFGGHHAPALLTLAQFSASVFVGFCPLVVALGHSKLRRSLMDMVRLGSWGRNWSCCQGNKQQVGQEGGGRARGKDRVVAVKTVKVREKQGGEW
ncbi:olfactory receptor class A-like protein 4 [Amia ocellicauda]|uniref:olfactory receptor class A-like protein 4 n=1 Tax=Amia ocellicauda TaxID=2972642 RepID=UPI003464430F